MSTIHKFMILLLLTASLFLTALFAMPASDRDTVETWEGSLRLFGNEPFTQIALVTDTGERWFLDMDELELEQLWKEERGRIRITGIPILKEYAGRQEQVIRVIKYAWIVEEK